MPTRWLDRILHTIEDGWHVWDTTSQADPMAIQDATWIRGRGVREMLVASIQLGAWTMAPHGRSVRVTAQPSADDELTPEDATRLAKEPLWILVENRYSDSAFVERVVTELDKSLHRLWRQPGDPIRFDSVGGAGQMPREIKHRTHGLRYRPRLVAIIDSDRKGPDDTDSQTAQTLRRECGRRNLSCWVLAKREAENYLPRILLSERQDAGEDHARLVEVWNRLNDDQKNFFDMKRGLPEAPAAIEQSLFDELTPADRAVLSRGFGPNVYTCWTLWNVQAKTELADPRTKVTSNAAST